MPKSLKLTGPFIHILKERKAKHCAVWADIAGHEAYLDAGDGATRIEKYRDECAKVAGSRGR